MTTNTSKIRTGFLSEMQRYPRDGWLAGVCRGIADYFDWKVQWVRVIVIAIALLTTAWPVIIVYGVLWYVMDEADLSHGNRPKWSDMPLAAARAAGTANAQTAAAQTATDTSSTMRDIKERFTRLDERLRKLEDAALNKDDALRREIDKLAGDDVPKT
jgi:phage shock protein C